MNVINSGGIRFTFELQFAYFFTNWRLKLIKIFVLFDESIEITVVSKSHLLYIVNNGFRVLVF